MHSAVCFLKYYRMWKPSKGKGEETGIGEMIKDGVENRR